MNSSIFTLLLFYGILSFRQENQNELLWSSGKKLIWENFTAKPDSNSLFAAVTDCRIKMDYYSKKDTLFVNVIAIIVQSESWVKPKSKIAVVLRHEQTHFDIAEIYARKLRQSILLLKTNKAKAIENLTLLDKWNDENLKYYQSLYDNETDHCINKKKQLEWEKKVAKELQELDAFEDTNIKIPFL